MGRVGQAIFLVGRPGVGKTTVVQAVVERLKGAAGGFYTREVRERGARVGFEVVTLKGEVARLAAKGSRAVFGREVAFGSYRVNLDAIEQVAVPSLWEAVESGQVVVIDEVGPMELLSPEFCRTVEGLLEGEALIFGTIVKRPHPFADMVKGHPRVRLRPITEANRERMADELSVELGRAAMGR